MNDFSLGKNYVIRRIKTNNIVDVYRYEENAMKKIRNRYDLFVTCVVVKDVKNITNPEGVKKTGVRHIL